VKKWQTVETPVFATEQQKDFVVDEGMTREQFNVTNKLIQLVKRLLLVKKIQFNNQMMLLYHLI
jgi:hypothetical protein